MIMKIVKMVLATKVIVIITIIIIKVIKCRGRFRTPKTSNTGLLAILQNRQKPLSNV